MVDNDYDSVGNLTRVAAFNREQRTMTWRADGTLQTVKVGPNTTTLSPPKRGIPESVTYQDLTFISAIIDDAGDIRSVTDENGFTTTYGYDKLRRLTGIDYPTSDTVVWAPTTIQYDRVGTEVGITGTHWRQTTSTGNARKIVHFDQRLRPRLTQEVDTANVAGTQRFVRRGFDYANRETFLSFPSASSSPTTGTTTFYDALGRVTDTAQDSELGTLTTETNYIVPFTTQFINARGKITSTTFQAFDEPNTSAPMTTSEPLAVTTSYTRDVFGKPLTLTRSGTYSGSPISQTRQYVYDPNQLLCKTIEAESGATILSYNASNLVEWKASGQALTDPANCQTLSVAANQKISYDYDQRDRLWRTRYGDGSPSVVVGFTPDGLPESVQSDNSTWTTLYNKRRLMTSETLNLGGVNYPLGYTHTTNGHVASLSYPDGVLVAYEPNALGEATLVGNYAGEIKRHPNGALKNLTYGNGIVHTTEQNLRGLPSRSHDVGVLDDRYVYDENANVTSITDVQLSSFTRSMIYDDRDRLTSATNAALWAPQASFEYDPLDNLRRTTNPTFGDWTYIYSATTRRLDRIDPTAGGAAVLTYGYDTRGRATSRSLAGTSQTFVVDLADRVTSVGPSVAAYRYDGHGRRTSVTKSGMTTLQVYSQAGQLLFQSAPASDGIFRSGFQTADTPYPPATSGNKRYVYLGRHLIAEDGTTGRSYIHTDALGSPARTTSTTGVPSAREDYKPYGWGAPAQSKPGYTGHVADAETGLSYMQARYYDPFAGRFLAVDPLDATPVAFNRYWYANNNPYKYFDPDGRDSGSLYTDPKYQMAQPVCQSACAVALGLAIDFTPVIGDIKGIAEAIKEPTLVNVAAAAVGLFGPVGDGIGKTLKNGAKIAENATQGAKAEANIVGELGDKVAGQRVTLEASTGERSVADIVEKDTTVHEVKSGNAQLSPGQKAVKADVDAGKPVIPRGKNARDAGLPVGQPTVMKCYKVDRC
jgi:RHS repeat-associated protein